MRRLRLRHHLIVMSDVACTVTMSTLPTSPMKYETAL